MARFKLGDLIEQCLFGAFYIILATLPATVAAHGGEPDHGGDLPVDLGGSRLQYEGYPNLVDVRIKDGRVEPAEVIIDQGNIVAFENQDEVEHRLVFSMGGTGHVDAHDHEHPVGEGHEKFSVVKPGKYWVLQFLVPGSFQYKCSLHGTVGTIRVRF